MFKVEMLFCPNILRERERERESEREREVERERETCAMQLTNHSQYFSGMSRMTDRCLQRQRYILKDKPFDKPTYIYIYIYIYYCLEYSVVNEKEENMYLYMSLI